MAESTENKKNLKTYLDALVDKEGLRTEVTVTLTTATLLKTALCLVGTAFIIIVMAYSAKAIAQKSARP